MTASASRRHALAETAASYGSGPATASHTKLSITLPADLADQVRQAAEASGTSVSGVIAAALRSAIATTDQARIDEAIEAQNDENLAWAEAFTDGSARIWAQIEW